MGYFCRYLPPSNKYFAVPLPMLLSAKQNNCADTPVKRLNSFLTVINSSLCLEIYVFAGLMLKPFKTVIK